MSTVASHHDAERAAADALALPFATAVLTLADDDTVLFLGARSQGAIGRMIRRHWCCEQSFRPWAAELESVGLKPCVPEAGQRYRRVLLLPPRQRDHARLLFARAHEHVAEKGLIVAAQANNEGARSGEDDLARLCGNVHSLSKHKCRVYWAQAATAVVAPELPAQWLALDALREIGEGLVSRPGLFSWDRIDAGSALLATLLPDNLHGAVADLGAGYGYLARAVLQRCPSVTSIDLYEADRRALAAAQANLAPWQDRVAIGMHWHDVLEGLPRRYHTVVCNPPFHQGRADQPELGRGFIEAAADALLPDGGLFLVANRHLPYEATLRRRFARAEVLADQGGYKVLWAYGPRS